MLYSEGMFHGKQTSFNWFKEAKQLNIKR